jgi:hypothetical protein
MPAVEPDLWSLTRGAPEIDPDRLAAAVEREALSDGLDFRTRLLIRDSVEALALRWGEPRLVRWLEQSPARGRIALIRSEDLGAPGFTSLGRRLMDPTRPEIVLQFLRELGSQVHRRARMYVCGSVALILLGRLARHTEDVDLVDEIPELRQQHDLLDRLALRYALRLAHFQSHFRPTGWQNRVQSLGRFGNLEVYLVDAYDIFLGKLFSVREKDRDDLRVLAAALDRDSLKARYLRDTGPLRAEPQLRDAAWANCYILYGEALPS